MKAELKLDDAELQQALSDLSSASVEELRRGLEEACIVVESDARRNVPFNSNNLRDSIGYEVTPEGEAIVGTSAPYAPYVEHGTGTRSKHPMGSRRRHAPFSREAIQNLTDYARSKGAAEPDQAAWAIAQAIFRRGGLEPQPYLGPAAEANRNNVVQILQDAMLRAIGRVQK